MALKILHTADVHLGMKFTRGYEPDLRENLIAARSEVIGRLVQHANDRECDLFIIAGDLFHNANPSTQEISAASSALANFRGQVLILPGNHDYYDEAPNALWERFSHEMSENASLLSKQEATIVEVADSKIALYPGPCYSSHSSENAIGWVKQARENTEVDVHIGVAHGNLEGVTPDFNQEYFPMTQAELRDSGVPLWLLGHAHIRYPDVDQGSDELAIYASTPEPDGFDCRHAGSAWIVTVENDGSNTLEAVQTGKYQFHELAKQVNNEEDLEKIKKEISKFDPSRDLVKLKLSGRLASGAFDSISEVIKALEDEVLYLESDLSGLLRQITQKDIDRGFTQKSFPHRLLSALAEDEDDALALQFAYELIEEVQS